MHIRGAFAKVRQGRILCLLLACLLAPLAIASAQGPYPETAFSAEGILSAGQRAPSRESRAAPAAQAPSTEAKAAAVEQAFIETHKAALAKEIDTFNTLLHGQALDVAQQQGGPQRYYLYLNKSSMALTIYYADALGYPTNRIHLTTTVAIGKRTTPTPSGTFLLGTKERWHYFGPSYSPYAIRYAEGRYLHGPLYAQADEATLNQSRLADFGTMATGGCIRMPYDVAQWIYENCSEDTILEIVNGDS